MAKLHFLGVAQIVRVSNQLGIRRSNKAYTHRPPRKKYEWVNAVLADTDYLTGQKLTAADAYLFVVTNWAKYVNLDIADLAHIQAFMTQVAARPAVREAMKAEGLP